MPERTGIEVQAIDKFSRVMDKFERAIDRMEAKTGKATKTVSKMGKQQESSFKKMAGSFKSAALQAVGFGAGMMTVQGAVNLVGGAIESTIGTARRMESAMAGVAISAQAASREFGVSVGTTDFWTSAVTRLSDELRVFSDVSVAQAISRTIDMTKRLGLTSQQMEEVVRRSGDLAAKVGIDLPSAVERVTSALRGEAESAEYLGLTLSETYMATHALELGFDKAWKSMTDLEKASVRYAAFLQQSEGVLGTAADSVNTLEGAEADLERQTERLSRAVGEELIPIKLKLVTVLGDVVERFNETGWAMARTHDSYNKFLAMTGQTEKQTALLNEGAKALAEQFVNVKVRADDYGGALADVAKRSFEASSATAGNEDALRDYGLELERTRRVSEQVVATKREIATAEEIEAAATKAAEERWKAYEKAVDDADRRMHSMIETLLSPTPVTQLDQWKTQLGTYQDKWDEAARRMRTIMEDPATSPWVKLMIPEEIRDKGVTAIKAYAAEWMEGFYTGLHPEAIDWTAFIQALKDRMAAAAAKERMLAEAMRRAAEDPELQDISKGMVEQTFAAMMGVPSPPVFGEMGEQMQGLTGLQIPELDAALGGLTTVTVPNLGLAVTTFHTNTQTQFTTLTTVTVPAFEARIVAMTETARQKFIAIKGWLAEVDAKFKEIIKSVEKLAKKIEDLPDRKVINIIIKYKYEGTPPPAQYGGIVAPNLPRGTPVPVLAHAGEAFLGLPYNPRWASRAVPGPSVAAGMTTVHRSTNVSNAWQFGPNTISGGMDLAVLQSLIKRTISDELH